MLKGNQISDVGSKHLGDALQKNGRLKNLLLSYNSIKLEGSIALAKGLSVNSSLEKLDLSYNRIDGAELAHWLGYALRNNSTLISLDLSHNKLGNESGKSIFEALSQNNDSRLSSLYLAGTDLSNQIAGDIATFLSTNRVLTTFDISTNSFDKSGVALLIEGFLHNRSLTNLNFSHNQVNEELVPPLLDSFGRLPKLEVLNCHSCFKGSCAATCLAKFISSNRTLKELDISGCIFEAPGTIDLCSAIAKNTSLIEIEMTSSGLNDDDSIIELANALLVNKTLKRLNLGYNGISLRGCKRLNEVQQQGRCRFSEETLLLEGNSGYKDKKGVIVRGGDA